MTSYFQNAQNFAFQGTIINAGNYIQHGSVKGPLESLVQHITPGALHNSEERCDAPKCHAETRVAVQQEIISWIVDGEHDDLPKKVLWMSGPAGTGKTAIAGSVAELCKEKGLLAATFFFSSFSGSRHRSSKRRLITTIAYQLVQHSCLEEAGKQILSAIERNPVIFEMSLKEQLEELILAPLREARVHCADISHWPQAIILDGLDEVEPEQQDGSGLGAQQARDSVHLEVLSLLIHAAHDPAFPFRILVVSRPERVIRAFFASEVNRKLTREVFLDEKYHPDADIELFLKSKFAEIQRQYNLPSPWPAEDAIEKLVENASGQFIYASTVIRFVSDNTNLPQSQLDQVLQLGTPAADEPNPLAALHALYTRILNSSPNPRLVVKWLKTIYRSRESPALFWKQLLESAPGEAEYLFSNLTSLISIPPPHDSKSPYILYHKSQWDFLHRIPAFHHLDVELVGPDSLEEFLVARLVRAVKDKGPPSLKNEAERDAFAGHLISSDLLRGDIYPLRSPNDSWFTQPTFSTWITHPSSEYDVLTCDVAWWIDRILSEHHPYAIIKYYAAPGGEDPWPRASEDLAMLFWNVHCQCSLYRCLPVCRLWRSTIIRVCQAHGWTVPDKWMLFRNRLIQWSSCFDSDGKEWWFMFPCGRDFKPPPELPEGQIPKPVEVRPRSQQESLKWRVGAATFPLS